MRDRVERLIVKAEQAADEGDSDRVDDYLRVAGFVAYLNREDAKDLRRTLKEGTNVLQEVRFPGEV